MFVILSWFGITHIRGHAVRSVQRADPSHSRSTAFLRLIPEAPVQSNCAVMLRARTLRFGCRFSGGRGCRLQAVRGSAPTRKFLTTAYHGQRGDVPPSFTPVVLREGRTPSWYVIRLRRGSSYSRKPTRSRRSRDESRRVRHALREVKLHSRDDRPHHRLVSRELSTARDLTDELVCRIAPPLSPMISWGGRRCSAR